MSAAEVSPSPEASLATSPRLAAVAPYILLVLVLAAPLAMALVTGALKVPFLDDWAYLRIAMHHAATGEIKFVNWNDVNLVGLLPFTWLSGKVFGVSIASMRLVTLVSYALLAGGVWVYARQFLSRPWAAFASLVAMYYPTSGYLLASLMTDVPALACQVWCLILGLRCLQSGMRNRRLMLVAALAVGFLGVTIRQQALVAPAAILLTGLITVRRRGDAKWWWSSTLVFGAAVLVFTVWRSQMPLGGASFLSWPPENGTGSLLTTAVFTMGFLLPVVALMAGRASRERGAFGALVLLGSFGFGVVAVLAVMVGRQFPFGGHGLSRVGALGPNAFLPVGRPMMVPWWLWYPLLLTMVTGSALAVAIPWHYWRRSGRRGAVRGWLTGLWAEASSRTEVRSLVVAIYAVASVALVLVTAYTTWFVFDRYVAGMVIVVTPPALAWAVQRRVSPPLWASGLAAFLALLSLAGTWDAQSSAVARWKAGEVAESLGYPTTAIDAGGEWVGYHYQGTPQEDLPFLSDRFPPSSYAWEFPRMQRQAVVLALPSPTGETPVASVSYTQWFGLAHRQLYIYEVTAPPSAPTVATE